MSSHSENARTTIEYRGSTCRIECSDAVSAKCLKAIELEDKEEVADLLAAKGANLNEICVCWVTCDNDSRPKTYFYTVTPLTLAANFASCDFIRWMLKHGADPNVKCDLTPLGVAVSMNKKRLVSLLVDSWADVNLKSGDSPIQAYSRRFMQTPLHIACSKGFPTNATYLLLKGALPDDDDAIENWLADSVRKYSKWNVTKNISTGFSGTVHPNASEYRGWKGEESFPDIVHPDAHCNIKEMEKEMEKTFQNFFCSFLDYAKNTPLHYACADGDKELVELILKRIHQSETISALNIENQSPAEVAFDFGRLEITFMLIEHGCHLSQRMLSGTYSCGNTLLHIACKHNRVAVAEKLMTAGSSLTVINSEGKSAMHYAWLSGELRNTVLNHVFRYPSFPRTMNIRTLRLSDLDLDMPTANELALYTTLCRVASEVPLGSFAVTDVNRTDECLCSSCGKLTPLACYLLGRRGKLDVVLLLSSCCGTSIANKELALLSVVDITKSSESDLKIGIEECIQKGANANAADCRGNTPLHLACRYGESEGIRILLDCGANPYVVNNEGMTPLDYAADEQPGQLLLSLIDRVDDDILSTVNSKGGARTKLLMLATADELSQQLANRLACEGARINPPATPSYCGSTARRFCLLDILARNGKWDVVCELVRLGCCDYTDDMFKSMFQVSLVGDQTSFYNMVQVWKWFSLAGFWQNNDFTAKFESFLELVFHYWQPERDTHTDASAATATSELKWLKDDVRNPLSLLRQCVYTIRRQLILADTTGRTIFPTIEKLPLPTRLKDSLKLEDLDVPAVCLSAVDLYISQL